MGFKCTGSWQGEKSIGPLLNDFQKLEAGQWVLRKYLKGLDDVWVRRLRKSSRPF